jgi:hypothetical protein
MENNCNLGALMTGDIDGIGYKYARRRKSTK